MNTNKASEQGNVTTPNRQNWGLIRRILAYLSPYKVTFILGLLFLLLSTATTLAIPYLASQFADITTIPTAEQSKYLQRVGLLMLGVLVLQGIFSYFRIVLFTVVSEKSMADLRRDIYNKIISLALPFFEERRIGELTSRITADVTQLQTAISINLAEILRQVATIIAGIVIILMTSFRLTLVMLATFPVGILAAVFFGKYIRKLSRQTQDALADSNIIVEESLQSIQAVKAYTNEWYEAKRYKNSLDRFVAIAIQTSRYRGLFVSFLITVVFGGIILVLWFGASYVKDGMMTVGELLRFILYTGFIGGSVAGTADLFSNLQKAMGAAEKVFGILDEKPEIQHLTQQRFPPINGNIDYQNVVFHYPTRPDLAILKGISLHIEQGKKVALVGASGAGKSTIVQLLMGFYRPTSGSISLNNRNISDYDLTALRQNIGIVPQDVVLFGGTIAENIRYGKPDATNEAVIAAARQANAYDFIMGFPQGMETMVGERGIKLSGGQRQRIAIARALLKNPNILILDEATSSLDSESESLVQAALEQLMHHRTTIIIAHRLATVRNVDQIYVIDQGQIAEQGTHEQLLQNHEGIYHNLIKLQFEHA